MNVFYTNPNPHIAANEHCDVHQVKMILEYSQLLSTAHHELGTNHATKAAVYKPTHVNHPSAIWVRQSVDHYSWLFQCLNQLHRLYSDRTLKNHKASALLHWLRRPPSGMECLSFTEPPVCAPDEFRLIGRDFGSCTGYQFYLCHKFEEWLSRPRPIKVEWTHKQPAWWRNRR